MRSNKFLWNVCMDIYREAFKKAKPSVDFDKIIKSGEGKQEGFFMKYYLPEKQLVEIVERHCKKNKITESEKRSIDFTIYLGSSPTSSLEAWKKTRKKVNK